MRLEIADWSRLPEDRVLRDEMHQELRKAIRDLPELYRPVILLRDMEELSTEETAQILDVSEDVVKTRLQAQINSLQHVERAGAGLSVPSGELYRGILASLRRIWIEEGIRGLYRGLGPVMVGYLPTWYV